MAPVMGAMEEALLAIQKEPMEELLGTATRALAQLYWPAATGAQLFLRVLQERSMRAHLLLLDALVVALVEVATTAVAARHPFQVDLRVAAAAALARASAAS